MSEYFGDLNAIYSGATKSREDINAAVAIAFVFVKSIASLVWKTTLQVNDVT